MGSNGAACGERHGLLREREQATFGHADARRVVVVVVYDPVQIGPRAVDGAVHDEGACRAVTAPVRASCCAALAVAAWPRQGQPEVDSVRASILSSQGSILISTRVDLGRHSGPNNNCCCMMCFCFSLELLP